MCVQSKGMDASTFAVTPAFQQHAVQTIQCKLIMMRICELRHSSKDEIFTSAIQQLHTTINALTEASKERRMTSTATTTRTTTLTTVCCTDGSNANNCQRCIGDGDGRDGHGKLTGQSACVTTRNARLRRIKRDAVIALVFTVRSVGGNPFAERTTVHERTTTFLEARYVAPVPSFKRVVRHEAAHFLHAFDQAVVNLYWHGLPPYVGAPPLFVRHRFLRTVLPAIRVVFPVQGDLVDCPICYEGFVHGSVVTRFVGCGHGFHSHCLYKYVEFVARFFSSPCYFC